jgi:uncharacterized membrane protein YdjX (TVP38/TMEM64 family)
MLTTGEKRFIKYWQDQRKGGRLPYYLLYILAGTFIASIVLSFLGAMFLASFPENLPMIILVSFVIVTIATVLTWSNNEKRFRRIIQREVEEGKKKDAKM